MTWTRYVVCVGVYMGARVCDLYEVRRGCVWAVVVLCDLYKARPVGVGDVKL